MAAARFPAKTPARTVAAKAQYRPVSEARKGRGEGWRVRAIGGADATRPEESGAQCCAVVCGELEKPARERMA